ncbi:SAM-dependent methyltransferase [Spirochaeta africana]|uniref:Methyltransferase, cyclopropane fatty acid synthase n=1 Tax=Spirochaeta africana (strain ATCC 700263 / DSM 8902 / Z-7692) TaxID=889378 RepID=H9UIW7_SPIAZ|nr:class I SAM-dependent methyltransferase [Spirochaeta africana]AFG37460.1 methyltransferase, cyclopropane fatty acid synthase [Spirochaeta africana DSM 8902]
MPHPNPRFIELFFDVFEHLPRQGPGNRDSAERALRFCRDLPENPTVLDLGCGSGAQTLQLAEMLPGSIVAVDSHVPGIDRLRSAVAARGLAGRVTPLVADFARLDLAPEGFDLVWSEGALYSIGLAEALGVCHRMLRPGGMLVFSDAIWLRPDPPPEVKAGFDSDYPTMGSLDDDLAALRDSGFEVLGHFTLPDEAWWTDFYTPMEQRIHELRQHYADDPEAIAILDELAREPDLHRRYSEYYAYEFFIARRSG